MRIVSLLPSATEIVYALELGDDLVGVTHECDWPAEARAKPFVSNTSLGIGGGESPQDIDRLVAARVAAGEPLYTLDQELVRELRPDVVLAQDLCRVCAVPSGDVERALETLGIEALVVSLDPNTLDEVIAGIETVGRAAGRQTRGEQVAASLRERVAAVAARAGQLEAPVVLALEWPDPPFVGGHWVPDMVTRAGGVDPLGAPGRPSRRVTWDEVAGARPDVVVCMPCGFGLDDAMEQARALYTVDAFRSTPACLSGRVFAVDASSYFSRPGPRVVDGLEALAWAVHGDHFDEPPAGRIARVTPL